MRDLKFIKEFVEKETGVKNLNTSSNRPEYVFPRSVGHFLARKYTDRTYTEIGFHIGNRDHATVMHGEKKIKKYLEMKNKKGDRIFEEEANRVTEIELNFRKAYQDNKVYFELEKSFENMLDGLMEKNEWRIAQQMINGIEGINFDL